MSIDEITQLIPTIKPVLRPFHAVPIAECGERLVRLSDWGDFAYESPHPYMAAGAAYGDASPFMLREGVALRAARALTSLTALRPGWRLKIFDGYRPIAVQAYMVAHSFVELARASGYDPLTVSGAAKDDLLEKTYRIWSPPNHDPATPPPHSTGAALDCTLVDEAGKDVPMGTPIDHNGPESDPDYFVTRDPACHANRTLLRGIMLEQGFLQHPREWWHYSYGDQFWTWLKRRQGEDVKAAMYGRMEA